jgi:ABC-2 type transport system ATP-binding protein
LAAVLEIIDVSKRYHREARPAVDHVSLRVEAGESVGLVGLNGAGKTTTLRMASGVTLPQGGSIRVDGKDFRSQKRDASRLVGWVPENPTHDGRSRLIDLLRYYADISGGVPGERPGQLLQEWGLSEEARSRFRELSLGQQKRLAIAAASLFSPPYFLLDEPFNGLDPLAFAQLRTWMEQARGRGIGLLLSSHNLGEVQAICERVIIIHHGRVISEMARSELDEQHSGPVTVILNRLDDEAITILERFGQVDVRGNRARISGDALDAGAITSALSRQGYEVRRITQDQSELEKVFLAMVEEAQ